MLTIPTVLLWRSTSFSCFVWRMNWIVLLWEYYCYEEYCCRYYSPPLPLTLGVLEQWEGIGKDDMVRPKGVLYRPPHYKKCLGNNIRQSQLHSLSVVRGYTQFTATVNHTLIRRWLLPQVCTHDGTTIHFVLINDCSLSHTALPSSMKTNSSTKIITTTISFGAAFFNFIARHHHHHCPTIRRSSCH